MKKQIFRLNVKREDKLFIKTGKTKETAVAMQASNGSITLKGIKNGN